MRPRTFLLLILALLVFADHSHGVPEIASVLADASGIGELPTTENTIRAPRQGSSLCNCKGRGGQTEYTRCLCPRPDRHSSRHKWRKEMCLRKKTHKVQKCRLFSNPKRGRNNKRFGPSVPI